MESSAISVLKRAVELDHSSRFQEALVCYQEGIQLLLDVLKGMPKGWKWYMYSFADGRLNMITVFLAIKDDSKKGHYREKIKGYMDRAEQIKHHVNKLKEGLLKQYSDLNQAPGYPQGSVKPFGEKQFKKRS